MDITETARAIARSEGGYVDDPADPGGPTNRGVTLATLRRLDIDVTGDGAATIADLRSLTLEQAADIFLRDYFHRPNIGALPAILQPSVFDMQVNAGAQAVVLLQKLLNRMGFSCAVDGRIGTQTASAAQAAARAAPHHIADAYGITRRGFYYALADARPALRKFARTRDGGKGGWITRAEAFVAERYHLTETEHRERIAKWT